MASGYGMTGGRSRCFPFWQDYLACNAQSEKVGECTLAMQDYMECLHHTKEVCDLYYMGDGSESESGTELSRNKARVRMIQGELARREALGDKIEGISIEDLDKATTTNVPRLNILQGKNEPTGAPEEATTGGFGLDSRRT
ncbi:hypothetical protein YB2330_004919 [Saitoella coloradoensis]